MTRLDSTLSPMSWILLHAGILIPLWAVFQPTTFEFLTLLGFYFFDFWLVFTLEKLLLANADPPILPQEMARPLERVDLMSLSEKTAWVEKMISYPARRARHCLWLTAIKLLPDMLVILFLWTDHPQIPLPRWLVAIVLYVLLAAYFNGMIYIENHALISSIFSGIHRRYDWSSVFARVKATAVNRNFRTHDYAALIASACLVLFTNWLVILRSTELHLRLVALQVSLIGMLGWILVSWLWYSSRGIFLSGLFTLFDELANFDPEKTNRSLPLHSTPVLAQFERAFNALNSRLRSYRRELSHRVYLKTEESRYQALGEMAGLVVHDLSTPLHIIRFCLEQLEQYPFEAGPQRYFQQLQRSSQRAAELVDSLRAYIRNPRGMEAVVGYSDAQGHVMRLLEVQFYSRGLAKVRFELDPALDGLTLRVAKADLIHILINLFANSIENLLANDTANPKICVKLEENRGKQVLLSFRDNGTGLSAEAFERLTALTPEPETMDRGSLGGLGLRLVRRLIERYHGSLTVVDLPPEEQGTLFHFWIPSVPGPNGQGRADTESVE